MFADKYVRSVYSGKLNKCMCGCSGKHTYNPQFREEAGKARGYTVSEEECNERTVRMIAKKVLNNPKVKYEGDFAWVDTDTRSYVVYFA